jgi:hypothetical protein
MSNTTKPTLDDDLLDIDTDAGSEAEQESSNLSLSDLQPKEALTFTLADGSSINFKQPEDMSSDDVAIMTSLDKRMTTAIERMQKNHKDDNAKQLLDRTTSHFIRLILPDLPESVLSGFKLGQKTKLVRWWNEHTGAETKKG